MWLPGVQATTVQQAAESGAFFMASYSIRARDTQNHTPPSAMLMVSWPAMAANPSGKVEILVVLPENPQ